MSHSCTLTVNYNCAERLPNINQPRGVVSEPQPLLVAFMGLTGAGKSTMIRELTGNKAVEVSGGINSCTQRIYAYDAVVNGIKYLLLDTPGFDDSGRSNTDVLREISLFLDKTYKKGTLLNGIIYVHRISDIRMGGSTVTAFRCFEQLCGSNFYPNVTFMTNRWDMVTGSMDAACYREDRLKESAFAIMLKRGSKYRRFNNKLDVVSVLIDFANLNAQKMRIQTELTDERKRFEETGAAVLSFELDRKEVERLQMKHQQDMERIRCENEAIQQRRNQKFQAQIEQERREQRAAEDEMRMVQAERIAQERQAQALRDQYRYQQEQQQQALLISMLMGQMTLGGGGGGGGRAYCCSGCGRPGHNIRTCPSYY
ncbi:P-loop containing nucleoside triphosphate hydrolase protein [Obelidium mucronatum]|nr:P-loop containing nucleoside triphosphate hydrolase protein [Obelidium mucronatum]